MFNISGGVLFISMLLFVVAIFTVVLLTCVGVPCSDSKNVLNKFEPDNTAPKITELIDYHKSNNQIRYKIESDDV